jgi:hypothetical protein
MKLITVGQYHFAKVDDEDYELVNQYTWYRIHNKRMRTSYAERGWTENGRHHTQRMHNLIMGVVGIDHKDHDGLNNQKHNLRVADQSQNGANRQPNRGGTSKYKGVHWDKSHGKWRASIRVHGSLHALGDYANELDAKHAYNVAALEYFGDWALT